MIRPSSADQAASTGRSYVASDYDDSVVAETAGSRTIIHIGEQIGRIMVAPGTACKSFGDGRPRLAREPFILFLTKLIDQPAGREVDVAATQCRVLGKVAP